MAVVSIKIEVSVTQWRFIVLNDSHTVSTVRGDFPL